MSTDRDRYFGIWAPSSQIFTIVIQADSKEEFISDLRDYFRISDTLSDLQIEELFLEGGQYFRECTVSPVTQ